MKKIWNLLFVAAIVVGFVGCKCECEKLKECEEKLAALQPGDMQQLQANKIEKVLFGPYAFGQFEGGHNICTEFKLGNGKDMSKMYLLLGTVVDTSGAGDLSLELQNEFYVDIGDSKSPIGIQWLTTADDTLRFQIVSLKFKVSSNSGDHLLKATPDLAMKFVDNYQPGTGAPVAALIGGEDIRSDYASKGWKAVSYKAKEGYAGLYYNGLGNYSGELLNVPYDSKGARTKKDLSSLLNVAWVCCPDSIVCK